MQDSELIGFLERREQDSAPFFCYRLPGESQIIFSAGRVVNGLPDLKNLPDRQQFPASGAFLAAPFLNPAENIEAIIPCPESSILPKKSENSKNSESSEISNFSESSDFSDYPKQTSRDEHRAGVETIRDALIENGGGKCVLSRVIVKERIHTLADDFLTLCEQRPDAFVFLFRTPSAGLWIGASPELLLAADAAGLHTMSLAGTRPWTPAAPSPGSNFDGWDEKNLEEQALVTDFIASTFRAVGLEPTISPLHTHQAGPVEHLCNSISAPLNPNIENSTFKLLSILSPTPALCGSPRELALHLISRCERHNRSHYGGFLGPYTSPTSFRLFVNLRSARLFKNSYHQFVGGGITRFSDPDAEWLETDRKASTLPPL